MLNRRYEDGLGGRNECVTGHSVSSGRDNLAIGDGRAEYWAEKWQVADLRPLGLSRRLATRSGQLLLHRLGVLEGLLLHGSGNRGGLLAVLGAFLNLGPVAGGFPDLIISQAQVIVCDAQGSL